MRRIRQIKNHDGMRLCAASIRIQSCKINGTDITYRHNTQGSVGIGLNDYRPGILRGVNGIDIAHLEEVVDYDDMFLIRGNFDVVRADDGLSFVGVVEALDITKVRDIKSGDMVRGC